ncbi:MAG: hypothetical protein M1530_01805, partial [Candidatus Marsarchaeota archaeon]|nr:hypothetical protein [Candidatus Marsarchaeota archaeon]
MLALPSRSKLIFLAAILSVLPLWIIPVAPLSDWPAHLGISREAYLLFSGQIENANYYLDFSFLGYSLVHLLLMALQYAFSLEISSKILLSVLFLLTPLCWRWFFQIIDPAKTDYAVIGLLMNYSTFFYFGNINYLFALNFGLVWLGLGLDAFRHGHGRWPLFALFGILTYLSHAYLFLFIAALLALIYAYQRLFLGKGVHRASAIVLALMLMLAGINYLARTPHSLDNEYLKETAICTAKAVLAAGPAQYHPGAVVAEIAGAAVHSKIFDPLPFLQSVVPLNYLMFVAVLLAIGFLAKSCIVFMEKGTPIREFAKQAIPPLRLKLDWFYVCLIAIIYLHYYLLPVCAIDLCSLDIRPLPIAMALGVLAIRHHGANSKLVWLVLALVLLNFAVQLALFSAHAPEQQQILGTLQQMPA